MESLAFFALNEMMTFLTIIIVFPGFLPPKDAMEFLLVGMFFFIMSFAWWLYLALAPVALVIVFLMGDLSLDIWKSAWPWKVGRSQ